jgi:hypothetical protein
MSRLRCPELPQTSLTTMASVHTLSGSTRHSAELDPETLLSGSRPLYLGHMQWEYSRFRPLHALRSHSPQPAPVLPAVIPMDVDRTRARAFTRSCFRCGAAGHLAQECPVTSDVQHTDILDEVVRQLGDNLLGKLFARVATTASLPDKSGNEDADPAGFPTPAE